MPPEGRDVIRPLYQTCQDDIINNLKKTSMSNISEQEGKTIAGLISDNTITIHPVDKGTEVVIMDTNDYIITYRDWKKI